jgi:disulfide bond formation protein DsbB
VSLFYTEFANFYSGEIGWYARVCMYPLSITTVLVAFAADQRAARYLLPFPLVGMSLALYGILLENQVVPQSSSCVLSGPGGCTAKWIDEFGYVTIPVMALSSFFLIGVLLVVAGRKDAKATHPATFPRPLSIMTLAFVIAGAAMAFVAVSAATTNSSTQVGATTGIVSSARGSVAVGREIFLSAGCSTCHTLAAAGSTGTVGPNLDDLQLPSAMIKATVMNGLGGSMPPFSGILSPEQISDVAAFVYSAQHARHAIAATSATRVSR